MTHSATKGDDPISWKRFEMKRGLSFTIVALLALLASVAMALDNNWSGAAFGCVAAGCLFFHGNRLVHTQRASERAVDAVWQAKTLAGVHQKSSRALRACGEPRHS